MDIDKLLSKATEGLTAHRAFGPPIERDETLIIPVAWVAGGGGGGDGGPEPGEPDEKAAGGGFGGVTWPLGIYVVKDGKVRWVPAVDATRIVLAGLGIFRAVVKLRALRHMKSKG